MEDDYKYLSTVILPGKRDGQECLLAQRLTEGDLFIGENNNFRQLVVARSLLYRCRVRKSIRGNPLLVTENTSALLTSAYTAEVRSTSDQFEP